MSAPLLLAVEGVSRRHPGAPRPALDDVSVAVEQGERLAIVGESGSGKSTLARILAGLERPTRGRVLLAGCDRATLRGDERRRAFQRVQIVLQDPAAALDPRWTVGAALAEPAAIWGLRGDAAPDLSQALAQVGLEAGLLGARPHELSGGQKQRVVIARALMLSPEVLILDEALSALDWVLAAELLERLDRLARAGLTLITISHDLAAVRALATRVLVLERGRVVEDRPASALFAAPTHPHTRALLDAACAYALEGTTLPSGAAMATLPERE